MEKAGTELLIFSRLFGGVLWEVISYAAGFTTISFKRYFIVTAIFGGIPHALLAYFFSKTTPSLGTMAIFVVTMVIIGAVFGAVIERSLQRAVDEGRFGEAETLLNAVFIIRSNETDMRLRID